MFDPTFARAGLLWTAMIEFIQAAEGSIAVNLESFVAQQLIRNPQLDSGQRKLLVHRFAIEGEVEGKSPLDLFLTSQTDLSNADRQIILNWRKSFVGLLEIMLIDPESLTVMNWLTAKRYRLQFTDLPSQTSMSRLKTGDLIIAQISRITTDWAILTPWVALGRLGKPKLAVAVGAFRQNYPHYLYSDAPEQLAAAWASVATYHDRFVEFFGADEITLSGKELEPRISEFQNWMVGKQLDAAGVDRSKSLTELATASGLDSEDAAAVTDILGSIDSNTTDQASTIGQMVSPKVELSPQLKSATAVTALSHPHWGQMFLVDYPRLKSRLADQATPYLPADLKFIYKCLVDPAMNTFVWRRLAAEFPQQLQTAIQQTIALVEIPIPKSQLPTPNSPFLLEPILTQFNKFLEPDLPDLASVPIHLHKLFQTAVLEVRKDKAKPKSVAKKTGFGVKS
jgi:hypothetical protein